MFKKFLAGLSAFALALGMVVLTAGSASAHTPSISATCEALTVNLTQYQKKQGDNTPNNVKVWIDGVLVEDDDFGTSWSDTFDFPQDGQSHTYRVKVDAWDGSGGTQYDHDTGTVTVEPCLEDDTDRKVLVCHKEGGSNYTDNDVSISSILNGSGHGGHSNDIIPPFDYVKQGVPGSYAGQNWTTYNQALWNNDCDKPEVTPIAPDFDRAECTGPGEYGQGSVTITAVTGVAYFFKTTSGGSYQPISAGTHYFDVGTRVYIKAEAESGYELKGRDDDWKWDEMIEAPRDDCDEEVTPAAPTPFPAECTGPNQYGLGGVNIPGTEGVQYSYRVGNSGPYTQVGAGPLSFAVGTLVQIKAEEKSNYELEGDDDDWKWSFTIAAPTGPCVVNDATASATPGAATCDEPGAVQFSITHASWSAPVNVSGNDWSRLATADSGHAFPGGAPTFTVYYTVNGPLDPDNPDCVTENALASATPGTATCDAPGGATFTIENATWNSTPPTTPGSHSVTATAVTGSVFPGGSKTKLVEYTVADTLSGDDCLVATKVDFTQALCNDDVRFGFDGAFVIVPAQPTGVYLTWTIDAVDQGIFPAVDYGTPVAVPLGSTVLFTAHAEPGYGLAVPGQQFGPFEASLEGELCTLPALAVQVDVVQPSCEAAGGFAFSTIDAGLFPGAVTWTVDGATTTEGSYTVSTTTSIELVATVADGYGLVDEDAPGQRSWTLDFVADEDCGDLETLALTGTTAAAGYGFAGLLLLAGGLLVIARRRRAVVSAE